MNISAEDGKFNDKTFFIYFGKILLRTIPIIAPKAIPAISILAVPRGIAKTAPPRPSTKMTAEMSKFLDCEKSTLCSTTVLIPIEAIIPKRTIEIPPISELGMVKITAPSLGTSPKRIANTAAIAIITGWYTLVRASTPVFSE